MTNARVLVAGVGVGVVVSAVTAGVVTLAYGGGADREIIPGLPTAGAVTGWGLPLARLIAELAAAVVVGNLVAAVFWIPRGKPAVAAAHRRVARWAAACWLIGAASLWLFTASDLRGLPVPDMLSADALVNVGLKTPPGQAAAWVVLAAASTLVLCARRTSGTSVAALAVAVFGLLPPSFVGHAVSSTNHRTAVSSLVFHILAAAVWTGGLAALLTRARTDRASLAPAAARYSRVALACFVVAGGSGVLNAYLRLVDTEEGLDSVYGTLIVTKVLALIVLCGFGWWHRESTLPGLAKGAARPFIRFAAVEILVLAATFGLAAGLARTETPTETLDPDESAAEILFGYPLPETLTVGNLVTDWWPDLFFLVVALIAAAGYLWLVLRARRTGVRWPVRHTIAWLAGVGVLAFATSSGLGRYGPVFFSVHMMQHVAIAIVAPALLTCGAPVRLGLRTLPRTPAFPGPREWLPAAIRSRPVRLVSAPGVAVVLWSAGVFGMYYTGVYAATLTSHAAHLLATGYLLGSGCLLFWTLLGVDPRPGRRVPPTDRALVALAALITTLVAGLLIAGSSRLIAADWYAGLQRTAGPTPPWGSSTVLGDQAVGGTVLWVSGVTVFGAIALALLVKRARSRRRPDEPADEAAAPREAVPVGSGPVAGA